MDLAYIHSLFFERILFYEPPCMGWIGRRYIIGLGFKGFKTAKDESGVLAWLDSLKDTYERPDGVPLTLLPEGTIFPEFQNAWEASMEICDQQIVDDFTNMFRFLVKHKDLWKEKRQDAIALAFSKHWKSKLRSVWRRVRSQKEWNSDHLRTIPESEMEKLKIPQHYVKDVIKHADLLYAMAQNDVILSWVQEGTTDGCELVCNKV
jgi:hypothetical protein